MNNANVVFERGGGGGGAPEHTGDWSCIKCCK